MKNLMLLAILVSGGCSGNSAGPSPMPPTVQTVTLTGQLTATNGGQPLADVQAALGATNVITGAGGAFSASQPPTASVLLALTGSSIVPRSLQVAMTGSRTLAVDAIALDGQFDLNFYRQFVRDANESPFLQSLRRWTTSPNLYLQTSGLADARTLDMVERVARESVSQWTSGKLGVATVERGPESRAGQPGWLTIQFSDEAGTGACGLADVGRSGGSITLYPRSTTCACDGMPVRPHTVRHEMGHALGFFHTDTPGDTMYRVTSRCDSTPTAREVYHAAIAYSRPVGNQDPDNDPVGTVSLAPMSVAR